MAETEEKAVLITTLRFIVGDKIHGEERTTCNKGGKGGLINISGPSAFFLPLTLTRLRFDFYIHVYDSLYLQTRCILRFRTWQ